jgi:16S rRNA (guanine527-N7)-methyltransferase
VVSWAGRFNLTAHRAPDSVVRRLVLDAAALLRVLPRFEAMVDLGSGAGFPGLPMAVLAPERRFLLVESRERRHHFQRAAVRELGLPNVAARRGRAEELEPEPQPLVLAQAMGAPSRVLPWMLPWALPGGCLVLPGGDAPPEPGRHGEIEDVQILRYQVPLGGPARTVWIGRVRGPREAR